MMNIKSKSKLKALIVLLTTVILLTGLTGCAALEGLIGKLKGDLVGNNYTITEYDNFGDKVMTVYGKKVSLEGISDGTGELTSYVNVTIDGHEW